MPGDGPAGGPNNEPDEPQKRSFLNRFSLNNLWRVAVVGVLGLTAGFGGLDQADPATPIELGNVYDNGPLRITPRAVFAICPASRLDPTMMRRFTYEASTYQLIALSATVKNTDKINVTLDDERKNSSTVYREIFTLTTPSEFKYYGEYASDSGSGKMYSLPPGKTVELLAIWGIPFIRPGIRPGDSIAIRLNDLEWKPDAAGSESWKPPKNHPSYGVLHTTLRECDS